jgi:D-amino-acid dehydrogenase
VKQRDVIIIGAGLAGITAAWMLQKRGWCVTVLDSREGPALEASFANAGALTPSEPEPWNAPGVHWQLLASLFDPQAAMKLRLGPLPGLVGWGLRFLANSTHSRHRAATLANWSLSRYSLLQTQAVRDELGLQFDNLHRGTMKLCRDPKALQQTGDAADFLAPHGMRFEILDRDGVVATEPQLAAIADKIAGAILYPDDESGDAHQFTVGLAQACEAAGVTFEWGSKVTSLIDRAGRITGVRTEAEEIDVDAVVLAAGHASWRLLAPLGLHLPVRPVKGYSLTLDMSHLDHKPGTPVVDEALHAIATPMGDRLRLAGTAEISGEDLTIVPARIDNLRSLLRSMYPELADTLLEGEGEAWAGLRPMSADGRPVVGQSRAKGLWLSTGHGHLGWTQSMGSAAMLADLICGEKPQVDPQPFSASRF